VKRTQCYNAVNCMGARLMQYIVARYSRATRVPKSSRRKTDAPSAYKHDLWERTMAINITVQQDMVNTRNTFRTRETRRPREESETIWDEPPLRLNRRRGSTS